MRKNMLAWLAIILLAITGIIGYQAFAESEESAEVGVLPGKRAAELQLQDLQGNAVHINAAQDQRIYVLNFWATWCPPCQGEMPELNEFAQENKDKVSFYAVNIQESSDKVSDFMRKHNYTMPVLLDKDGDNADAYHVQGIPTIIMIDKSGIIQYRKTGAVTKAELEAELAKLAGDR